MITVLPLNRDIFENVRLHAVLTQDIFGHLIDFESKESRDCNYMPGILKYLVNIYFLIEPDQNPALCSCTES